MKLYEKYRPKTFNEVLGQEKAADKLSSMAERGMFAGNAFLFTGKSGTGKTSLAWIIARHVADDHNIVEFDASDCTKARIANIEEHWQYYGMGEKLGRAWIVNECHTMTSEAVSKWLTTLERIPPHCVIIFTSTIDGIESFGERRMDAAPFVSRCVNVILNQQGLRDKFAELAREIALKEGLSSEEVSLDKFKRLVKNCNTNMRSVLQQIEMGQMMEGIVNVPERKAVNE